MSIFCFEQVLVQTLVFLSLLIFIYIFAAWILLDQITEIWNINDSSQSGCKDKWIRELEYEAKYPVLFH